MQMHEQPHRAQKHFLVLECTSTSLPACPSQRKTDGEAAKKIKRKQTYLFSASLRE